MKRLIPIIFMLVTSLPALGQSIPNLPATPGLDLPTLIAVDQAVSTSVAANGRKTYKATLQQLQTLIGGGGTPALPTNQIFVGSAANVATAVPLTGDCSIVASGLITCTRTNNIVFSALATLAPGTGVAAALANPTNGTSGLVVAPAGATGSTFLRGDYTWASPSGSGTVNSGTTGQVAYYAGVGTAVSGETLSALMDSAIGAVQGNVLYRSAAAWSVLAPGTNGQFLQTQGASANPQWATVSGSGTVATGTPGNLAVYTAGTTVGSTTTGTGVVTALGNTPNAAGGVVLFSGALGTPTSGTATNLTGLPIAGLTGLGTGVATALANATNAANGLVTFNGALGTPTSGTATNLTGLPIAGLTGLGTGVATALSNATNAASGLITFSGALGTPTSGVGTNLTALNASNLTSGTVPPAQLPLATTGAFGAVKPDGTTITISAGVITSVGGSATAITVGTTNVGSGTSGFVLYDNAGVLGNLGIGTGLSVGGGNINITGTITAGGPIGSATVAPIITYNAQGQLTTVTSATITPAWSSITSTPTTLAGYGITSPLDVTEGGTAANLSATGGAGQYLKQITTGAAVTVGVIAAADLPLATTGAFGAVKPDGTTITVSSGVISSSGGGTKTYSATTDPGASNDNTQGYAASSLGINTNTGRSFVARSVATGAAVWDLIQPGDHPGYVGASATQWYPTEYYGTTLANSTGTLGTMYAVMFFVKERLTISNLGTNVTTLSASGNFQLAIYSDGINASNVHRPNVLLANSSASGSTSATGFISTALTPSTLQLEPGVPYWIVRNCDNSTARFIGLSSSNLTLPGRVGSPTGASAIGAAMLNAYSVSQTFGTWPSPVVSSVWAEFVGSTPSVLAAYQVASVP